MRRTDTSRRVLRDITKRDSFDSRIELGVLVEPFSGGNKATVSIKGNAAQVAYIPSTVVRRAVRRAGSPVTLRVKAGVAEVISWGDEKPYFYYTSTTPQGIATGSIVLVTFEEEDIVTDELDLLDYDTGILTIPDDWDGQWEVDIWLTWAANANGYRRAWIYLNSSQTFGDLHDSVDDSTFYQHLSISKYLVSEDEIDFRVRQNGSTSLNITGVTVEAKYIRG